VGKVVLNAAASLDGYVADNSGGVGPLFDYYFNGDVEVTLGDPDRAASARRPRVPASVRDGQRRVRCHRTEAVRPHQRLERPASYRRGGLRCDPHATDWPYPDAPYTFVADGVRAAIAKAKDFAGDRDVSVTAGNVGGQATEAGLVDQVNLSLVPVLLGSGVKFFGD
jgi:hypothetical protein